MKRRVKKKRAAKDRRYDRRALVHHAGCVFCLYQALPPEEFVAMLAPTGVAIPRSLRRYAAKETS